MQPVSKIYVIGIGYKPLDKGAREIILNSEIILASSRLFEVFKTYEEYERVKDKIKVINNVDETMNFIRTQITEHRRQNTANGITTRGHGDTETRSNGDFVTASPRRPSYPGLWALASDIVLLASGDPLFFGIGRRVIREFGKDVVEILPDLSSIQMAFSRIKEPWDDAFLMSLHGGPAPEKRRRLEYEIKDIPYLLTRHNKIAILTDKENNPSAIAKEILNYIMPASQNVIARSVSNEAIPKYETASPEPALRDKMRFFANAQTCPERDSSVAFLPQNDRKRRDDRSEGARNNSIKMYVCEKLGYPDEKITEGTPEEIAGMSFSDPNVVIILSSQFTVPPTPPSHPLPQGEGEAVEVPFSSTEEDETRNIPSPLTGEGNGVPNTPPSPLSRGDQGGCFWGAKGGGESLASEIRFGIKEGEILHSKGLITKDEVRAVTIHKLRLPYSGIFWDIGAGSGSVSIEVSRICPGLRVFAIEKDDEQIENITKNKKRSNIANIEIIKGEASDALKELPVPDRVFIGGSGGRLERIVNFINKKMLSGIIVINATTIETLNEAIKYLEDNGFRIEISEVSISRSKIINQKRHMNALNPVFIIVGER